MIFLSIDLTRPKDSRLGNHRWGKGHMGFPPSMSFTLPIGKNGSIG